MTRQEEIDKIKADKDAEIAASIASTNKHYDIKESIAGRVQPRNIWHDYQLYGSYAELTFGKQAFRENMDDSTSIEELKQIVKDYPPVVGIVSHTDGCKSYVPADYPPKYERTKVSTLMTDFHLRMSMSCVAEHGHDPDPILEYYTEIEGNRIDVKVHLKHREVFEWKVEFARSSYNGRMGKLQGEYTTNKVAGVTMIPISVFSKKLSHDTTWGGGGNPGESANSRTFVSRDHTLSEILA